MRKVLKGNHAVSYGVKLSRTQVISAFPITPQTSIVEELSEMCATGELNARFIKVESEHSAMAALLGASTAGVRAFTATSGNGLLLMHEVLHWASGARLPIVLANVNRAVGGTWNIWADQTDSLAQRDTGWLQFYCESNQEVLDGVIMSFKLAESLLIPVMIAYDAFFLSHTAEVVDVPDIHDVDAFLPLYKAQMKLDLDDPHMFGGMMGPEIFYEARCKSHFDAMAAIDRYREIAEEFGTRFGRKYDLTEDVATEDADTILVTAGTITSVARLAVEQLRAEGKKVGLMKLRMFRPVPAAHWRKVLGHAKQVVVIDRNLIAGLGGVFAAEVASALYPLDRHPRILPVVAGLGGRDVTPEDVVGILNTAMTGAASETGTLFWGLKE